MTTPPYLEVIDLVDPGLLDTVKHFWNRPLSEYVLSMFKQSDAPLSSQGRRSRQKLQRALVLHSKGSGQDDALDEFDLDEFPAIQTGPHCQLLLDPQTFWAWGLTWYGAAMAGKSRFLVYNCSTVKLETAVKNGPGWVPIAGYPAKIFELRRTAMAATSTVCLKQTHQFSTAELSSAFRSAGVDARLRVDIFDTFREAAGSSAADLISSANSLFFGRWTPSNSPRPIFIDDRFVARLIALHVVDDQSLIFRMLFDPVVRNILIRIQQEHKASRYGNLLRNNTSYFWMTRSQRVRRMVLKGNHLVEEGNDANSVELSPAKVHYGLGAGLLLPSLFLTFAALSILPQIRALGGAWQIGYYPIFHKIIADVVREVEGLDDVSEQLALPPFHGLGMDLVDRSHDPIRAMTLARSKPFPFSEAVTAIGLTSFATSSRELSVIANNVGWMDLYTRAGSSSPAEVLQ